MTLSRSLGRDYMDQFYKGAFFSQGKTLYMYKGHLDGNTIAVSKLNNEGTRWSSDSVHTESIKDMSAFAWPKLGYREFMFGDGMNLKGVWLVVSSRSAMRGLQDRHVLMRAIPQIQVLGGYDSPKDWIGSYKYMKEVFFPTFTRFGDGMSQIREGKAMAVALSEDFAVSISTSQGPSTLYDVLFRGEIVGEVLENLDVILPRRMCKRASVINLFEGRVRV